MQNQHNVAPSAAMPYNPALNQYPKLILPKNGDQALARKAMNPDHEAEIREQFGLEPEPVKPIAGLVHGGMTCEEADAKYDAAYSKLQDELADLKAHLAAISVDPDAPPELKEPAPAVIMPAPKQAPAPKAAAAPKQEATK